MRSRTLSYWSWSVATALLALMSVALAQEAAPPAPQDEKPSAVGALKGRPDAPDEAASEESGGAGDLLGEEFVHRAAGIALRPPAGSKVIRKFGGDEVVEFVQAKRRWTLKLSLITMPRPIGLITTIDEGGREISGLMEITLERVLSSISGAKVLRQDVVNVEDGIPSDDPRQRIPNVGMLALRYTQGLERLLSQHAIIQANERMYYVVTLTSPGKTEPVTAAGPNAAPADAAAADAVPADGAAAKAPAKGVAPADASSTTAAAEGDEPIETAEDADPRERDAVEAFRGIIDSIKLLDRSKLKEEQTERLFKTRALFVNLTEKRLTSALVPEQWFRLIHNGTDVGYVYTVEGTADGIPQADDLKQGGAGHVASGEAGILVGTRSRLIPPGSDRQLDAESWMFVTMDRKYEEWSSVAVTTDRKTGEKNHVTEVGTSRRHVGRVLDGAGVEQGLRGDGEDEFQPPVKITEDYLLNVTYIAMRADREPVARSLPPFYLPQALGHLLPRLVPLNQPKGYMFASYVGELREVMARYVDVEEEQRVNLAGEMMRAIPVRDRITLDGSVTTHYMSREGKYLGSENSDSRILVLPTDAKTLQEIWKDANLTRPDNVQQGEGKAAAPSRPAAPTRRAPAGQTPTRLPATPQKRPPAR